MTSTARLVLAAFMLCAATTPMMAQDPVIDGGKSAVEAGTPVKQETEFKAGTPVKQESEYKTSSGTVEIERERDSSGAVSTTVDRDWSAGTWLAIGLGVLVLGGIGYAMTNRRDHFDGPITTVR